MSITMKMKETWSRMTVATLDEDLYRPEQPRPRPALFFGPPPPSPSLSLAETITMAYRPESMDKDRRTRGREDDPDKPDRQAATAFLVIVQCLRNAAWLVLLSSARLRKRDARTSIKGLPAIEIPITIQHLSTYDSVHGRSMIRRDTAGSLEVVRNVESTKLVVSTGFCTLQPVRY
jgi:hypothetical protein